MVLIFCQSNAAQPLLKLRFASLVVSDSTAKETRIKVTICGITYTLYPDIAWLFDVIQFVKAPPGVCADSLYYFNTPHNLSGIRVRGP